MLNEMHSMASLPRRALHAVFGKHRSRMARALELQRASYLPPVSPAPPRSGSSDSTAARPVKPVSNHHESLHHSHRRDVEQPALSGWERRRRDDITIRTLPVTVTPAAARNTVYAGGFTTRLNHSAIGVHDFHKRCHLELLHSEFGYEP